jgi:RNA polymerase sigma factor (sigma-70 family)
MRLAIKRPARDRRGGEEIARLLESAKRGNSEAWDELVEEFGGMVWAVARSHRMSDADAADVVQTTWLRLLERVEQINEPARVGAWLATTARRECLRVLRKSHRDVLSGEEPMEHESPDAAPDDVVLLAERDQMLWRCFGRLRPSDQALLRLMTADPPRSYEEISAALDMPIGSIGPTRARALARLRGELERESELSLFIN